MKFYSPKTVKEAMELRRATPGAVYKAGGTHLMARLRAGASRAARPSAIIALGGIPRLQGMEVDQQRVRLGAMTSLGALVQDRDLAACCPPLLHAAAGAGPPAVREAATIGGDLCEAEPGCHTAPVLLVLDAWVRLQDRRGIREVGLEYFFVAPGETGRTPGEVLTSICFRRPSPRHRVGLVQSRCCLGRVTVAGRVVMKENRVEEVRLAATGAAPTPVRLEQVEELLDGALPSRDLLHDAGRLAARCAAPLAAGQNGQASAAYGRRSLGIQVTSLLGSLTLEKKR